MRSKNCFLRLLGCIFLSFSSAASADDWTALAKKLEDTKAASIRAFQLRDDKGHGLDCLEVFQASRVEGAKYLGLSHSMRNGVFSIHLAESSDLKNWKHVVELDKHGSQGTVYETKGGRFLIAYEKDAPNSCWIRVRSYPHLAALRSGKHEREIDLPRTLAPTAEGTPSFESVEIESGDLSRSVIKLRFHYFQKVRVDQLAHGTLTNFSKWKADSAPKLNQAFQELGGKGNLGDRSKFTWKKNEYYLQEVQTTRLDWGTWGIFLCDRKGLPLQRLRVETPGKSRALSNPAVSVLKGPKNRNLLIFTAFLHSKGSARTEAGQMLVAIPMD